MIKWLMGFVLAAVVQVQAALIHVDFVAMPGHVAEFYLTSDVDQIVVDQVRLALEWENAGAIQHVGGPPIGSSLIGFPFGGPNANLADGDAVWFWNAPFNEKALVLDVGVPTFLGSVVLDTDQWLRLTAGVGGVETRVTIPSGENFWDGQLAGAVLPEAQGIVLLLAGIAGMRVRRARLNCSESPKD